MYKTKDISVLIVDDEEELAATIAERLEIRGIKTQTASDGDSALSLIATNPPDVVVLDLMMPENEVQRVRDRMQAYIDSGAVEASVEEKDDFDAEY